MLLKNYNGECVKNIDMVDILSKKSFREDNSLDDNYSHLVTEFGYVQGAHFDEDLNVIEKILIPVNKL